MQRISFERHAGFGGEDTSGPVDAEKTIERAGTQHMIAGGEAAVAVAQPGAISERRAVLRVKRCSSALRAHRASGTQWVTEESGGDCPRKAALRDSCRGVDDDHEGHLRGCGRAPASTSPQDRRSGTQRSSPPAKPESRSVPPRSGVRSEALARPQPGRGDRSGGSHRPGSQEVVRPDHRPPHVGDRRAVEAQAFLRLLEVAADDVGELLGIDVPVVVEGVDVVDRDQARGHVPAVIAGVLVRLDRCIRAACSPARRTCCRHRDR